MRKTLLSSLIVLLALTSRAECQTPQQPAAANSEALQVWEKIQQPTFASGRTAQVSNLTIQRDRIQLVLTSGQVTFAGPVNGVVFAAVFQGQGRLQSLCGNSRMFGFLDVFGAEFLSIFCSAP